MNVALERKVRGGFAFSLSCLAVVAAVSWFAVSRLRQDAAWVEHTHQVLNGLESLVTVSIDAERAEAGYVITGRDTYLATRASDVAATRDGLQRLGVLTSDSPLQQQRLQPLSDAISKRLAAGTEIIELRRSQGMEAASQAILAGTERGLHGGIRRRVDEMQATERTFLKDREARAARSATIAETVIVIGGLLAFAIVGVALIAIGRDFAGRRRAEAALREANDHLEQRVAERTGELAKANTRLLENERLLEEMGRLAEVGGWEFDPQTGKGQWTTEVARIHDLDPAVDPSKELGLDFYPGESRARIEAAVHKAVVDGIPYDLELEFVSAKGVRKWVRTISQPVLENGVVVKVRGALQDITERRQSETKLREQVLRLNLLSEITRAIGERQDIRSIFQSVVGTLEEELPVDFGCICLYDAAGHFLSVASVGLRTASLAGEMGMTPEARIQIDQNGLSRCVRGQLVYEPDIQSMQFAFPQRLSRGGLRSLVAAPLQLESSVFGILVVARNRPHAFSSTDCEFLRQLSEHVALATHQAQLYGALQEAYEDLRKTQQAVMQQERLRALGEMASGIAHDINNAISPVMLYTESLLESESGLSARARDYLETIQRAIADVAQTVARMREFYREREPQLLLVPINLNELAKQVLDLTRVRWADMPQQRGIVIHAATELAADLPAVMGVASEIREALTNLVFNAVDAMPEGGAFTLRTRLTVRGSDSPENPETREVHLEVVDTGVGMDDDTRRRCLEPFFTTKGERGTGLGLAMVYGAIQRNRARIDIESAPGQGTTMRLSFIVPNAAVAAAPTAAARAGVPGAALRILLVDDDPMLLKSLQDALQGDGHSIVAARGGREGIDVFRAAVADGKGFGAVITDLGMPHVDGRQVAAAVKEASRTTPVIMLTGWGQRLIGDGDTPSHVDRLLSKPPKLRELREALAAVVVSSEALRRP
jgi:signal transduction histidine kinase/PAS domain-containing protein/ActR/RegA family two-component response regulator